MNKTTYLSISISILILIIQSAIYAQNKKVSTKLGGVLSLSVSSDPKTFNPLLASETSSTYFTDIFFRGLMIEDIEHNIMKPALAESYTVSKDKLTWIFTLRNNLKWSDGEEITANDVAYTFNNLIYNDKIPTALKTIFTISGKKINVKAISNKKILFKLPDKFFPFLSQLSTPILPKHIFQPLLANKNVKEIYSIRTAPKDIVVSGPFLLESYKPSEEITLRKNIYYYLKDKSGSQYPYLDRIKCLITENQDIALLKFQTGEIDLYEVRGSDYGSLKKLENEGNFKIYGGEPDLMTQFFVFNQNDRLNSRTNKPYVDVKRLSWFKNKNFRTAIASVINRDKIIADVFNGFATKLFSPLSPKVDYYFTDQVIKYEYNIDKAKKILEKEGFRYDEKKNVLRDKEGNRVEFKLSTNSNSTTRLKTCGIFVENLSRIGIEVHFTPLLFNELVVKLMETYDWEAIFIGFTGESDPNISRDVWNSGGMLHLWNPKQKAPNTKWEKEIDEIFEKTAREFDLKKRKELFDRWQYINSEELPVIYTHVQTFLYAAKNYVKNLNIQPNPKHPVLHNVDELYITKDH